MGKSLALLHLVIVFSVFIVTSKAIVDSDSNYNPPSAVKLRNRDCQALLQHNRTLYNEVSYKGHLTNYFGSPEADAQLVAITYKGCIQVCGSHWRPDSRVTLDLLLDWILPAVGLIMQMPWSANTLMDGMICLFRWIGSPIAALTFCLWDVKITHRCAKLVDYTTRFRFRRYHSDVLKGETEPEEELRAFLRARDTFYILMVMNQFQLLKVAENSIGPTELVMAVEKALFGNGIENGMELVAQRKEIAKNLRESRCRGVVPILLGLFMFFFAMGVAISKAFAIESEVATAFNIGLGLLIAWLPVLNIAAIVDADHDGKSAIAESFNELVSACHKTGEKIQIFGDGKGQGRGRWHYGIGQTIMSRIEHEYLPRKSKTEPIDWEKLVARSPRPQRHIEFSHWRIIEPMMSAFIIVAGISSGSFILAYFTPPVGIAWRSSAYLACLCFAVLIFLIDITLFKIVRHSFMTPSGKHGPIHNIGKSVRFRRGAHVTLIVLEMLNTALLGGVVVAMASGLFNFCGGSVVDRWGPSGGIVILNDGAFYSKYFDVISYWILGIVPGMILMSVALLYLIEQWASQSFLWARNDAEALRAWKKTRRWKKIYTFWGALELGEKIRWTMKDPRGHG